MKFVFTESEMKVMHKSLAGFMIQAAGRDRKMRRHAHRLAKKFTPTARFVDLSPKETFMLSGVAINGVKQLESRLLELVDADSRSRAQADIAAFKAMAEKLARGLASL